MPDLNPPAEPNSPDQHNTADTSISATNPPNNTEEHFSRKPASSSPNHAKDSPLTDIGTSPPAFELHTLVPRKNSRDSYESSELSDLGDDDSEAETDKMDFLDDDNGSSDRGTDLQRLSELTELARLRDVDSDDSDVPSSPKRRASEDIDRSAKKQRPDIDTHSTPVNESGTHEPEEATEDHSNGDSNGDTNGDVNGTAESFRPAEVVEEETEELIRRNGDADTHEVHSEDPSPAATANGTKDPEEPEDEETKDEPEDDPEDETKDDPEEDEPEEDETKEDEVEKAELPNTADEAEKEEEEAEAEADVEDVVKQEEEEHEEQEEAERLEESEEEAKESDINMEEHRRHAVDELISIEGDFAHLRDKLYQDKLALLEHELQLCLEGSHPELLQIYLKVNDFYQDNMKIANATLNYSLRCINKETIATRTAIHQDHLRRVMDLKSDMTTDMTSLWYKINKERNYMDQLVPDYNFSALPAVQMNDEKSVEYYGEPSGVSKKTLKQNTLVELVQNRNRLNDELGVLNGLKEFYGIPCAISTGLHSTTESPATELLLRKATSEEIDEDLRAMGIDS